MKSHPLRRTPRLALLTVSFIIPLVFATFTGCAPVRGIIPPPVPVPAPPVFEAGAASVDITPPPGYSTGAYSLGGDVTRGVWTRLHSRALYLGDPGGERLVLVSCELWSIPAGLVERTAEILREDSGLGWVTPGRLVVAATHTHHGPGHYATHPLYNEHAQLRVGFDPHLFEFLAQRIARSVRDAWHARRPAQLLAADGRLTELARNRSLEAFLTDPEAPGILRENADLPVFDPPPEYPDPLVYQAVDPRLRTLRVIPRGRPDQTIALAVFAAIHPTVVQPNSPLTSSDFTGVAMRMVESELDQALQDLRPGSRSRVSADGPPPTAVALFLNGAEGDISPDWRDRDFAEAVRLGRRLADATLGALATERPLTPGLTVRSGVLDLAGRRFLDFTGAERKTASYPLFGAAVAGGTEDGFTELHALGWKEGVRRDQPRGAHGYKLATLDPKLSARFPQLQFTRWFLSPDAVPHRMPLTVARLGEFTLATLPGEFTVVLGRRIAEALAATAAAAATGGTSNRDDIVLVGLANAYASYFTTPEEYDLQMYEGASTIYGAWSGLAVGASLVDIARRLDQAATARPARKYQYHPGRLREFGPETLSKDRARDLRIVSDLVRGLGGGRPVEHYPSFTWTETYRTMKSIAGHPRIAAVPSVSIEGLGNGGIGGGSSTGDDNRLNGDGWRIIVLVDGVRGSRVTWRAIWIPAPETTVDTPFRFVATGANGTTASAPFTLRSVPAVPLVPAGPPSP